MANLLSLTRACGTANPPGTKLKLYVIPKGELTAWPQTKAELGGTAQGDTKILDEPFAYVSTTALGYWREYDILVDTGDVRDILEGEPGGQGYRNFFDFSILGTEAEQLEVADCMAAYSGCIIAMIIDKNDNHRVLGNLEIPAFIESAEGATGKTNGDRRGFNYVLYSNTGKTAPIYDAATHGFNLTPNV